MSFSHQQFHDLPASLHSQKAEKEVFLFKEYRLETESIMQKMHSANFAHCFPGRKELA